MTSVCVEPVDIEPTCQVVELIAVHENIHHIPKQRGAPDIKVNQATALKAIQHAL